MRIAQHYLAEASGPSVERESGERGVVTGMGETANALERGWLL